MNCESHGVDLIGVRTFSSSVLEPNIPVPSPVGRKGLLALFAATAFFALSLGHGAQAAEGAAASHGADAADPSGAGAVGELLVTARHRSEALEKVPVAISVLGGAFLAQTNTTTIAQVAQFIPSVQYSFFNPRNINLNIRGLGNNIGLASDGIEPGVGFYVDGVYYDRPATATFDLIDVDRIEVLRGPQGTLFGKNTTAGAIVLITASPTFKPEAWADLSGGDYGYLQAKAAVSGPIWGDAFAGRLSVAATTRQGFVSNAHDGGNKVNDYRNATYRGQVLYAPDGDLRLRLIADYSKQNTNCCANVLSGIVNPPNGKNFASLAAPFGYVPVVDPFRRRSDTDAGVSTRQETGGLSLQGDWSSSKVVVTSVTALRFWNISPRNDADFTPAPVLNLVQINDHQSQFSQELRIASTGVNRLDYVGGLYLFHDQIEGRGETQFGRAATAFLIGPAVPSVVADGYTQNTTAKYRTTSVAAFGQATWRLDPQWSLTGGLRYGYDEKKGAFDQTVSGGVPLVGALAALAPIRAALSSPTAFDVSYHRGDLSYQADLAYQPTDSLLAYLNLSRGYKAGGLNLSALPPGATEVIQPESIDSFEAGVKAQMFDRRVIVNADLFWERDRNYQANIVVAGTSRQYLANVPRVRSEGVEADVRAQPLDGLSVYASGTYDEGVYESFPNSPCPLEQATTPTCDLSGRTLAGVPRWAAAAGGEYSHRLSLGARETLAYAGLDYSFRSSLYSAATDSIYSRLPSLNLVNARLGFRAIDGGWDVFVWGRNVFNAKYFNLIGAGIGNTGELYAALGDPATVGVTLRVRR